MHELSEYVYSQDGEPSEEWRRRYATIAGEKATEYLASQPTYIEKFSSETSVWKEAIWDSLKWVIYADLLEWKPAVVERYASCWKEIIKPLCKPHITWHAL